MHFVYFVCNIIFVSPYLNNSIGIFSKDVSLILEHVNKNNNLNTLKCFTVVKKIKTKLFQKDAKTVLSFTIKIEIKLLMDLKKNVYRNNNIRCGHLGLGGEHDICYTEK